MYNGMFIKFTQLMAGNAPSHPAGNANNHSIPFWLTEKPHMTSKDLVMFGRFYTHVVKTSFGI